VRGGEVTAVRYQGVSEVRVMLNGFSSRHEAARGDWRGLDGGEAGSA